MMSDSSCPDCAWAFGIEPNNVSQAVDIRHDSSLVLWQPVLSVTVKEQKALLANSSSLLTRLRMRAVDSITAST